jgi:2,3-bisphosphoglycerate-dependent phosphoglycerate mutase
MPAERTMQRALLVIVSHGQLMSWLLHSIDPAFGYAEWEALSNPDVYAIGVAADGALAFERFWR